ncbi:MAG: substrate-binding domain-containing protein [Bacteroidetes bacterium]|nr:substrate-binding domain-containing protein [Bacteroidota bacterium]
MSSFLLLLLFFASCGNDSAHDPTKTGRNKIYKGNLNIVSDVGLEPIVHQQAQVFEHLNDSIAVHIEFKSEAGMLDDFRSGKAQVMLLTRMLTEREKEYLKMNDTIYVRELEVAHDAIAMIGNPQFNDVDLDTLLLKKYFTAKETQSNYPVLVFDNQNMSIIKQLFAWAKIEEGKTSQVYALPTSEAVIAYVEQHPNSIGFIPYALVSDEDEQGIRALMKRVKILSLRTRNEEGNTIRVSANQSDIATGDYPFTRSINAVIRYGYRDSIEWRFMNFLFREKGAKVFLKAGWVPAKMPEREINVNTGEIPITN